MGEGFDFRKFTIYVKKEEEGGYSGKCLELPAAISQGETIDELKNNMVEAIQLVIEHMKAKVNKKDSLITLEVPLSA
jgi:predicted RNase H-like HicB family nuclease